MLLDDVWQTKLLGYERLWASRPTRVAAPVDLDKHREWVQTQLRITHPRCVVLGRQHVEAGQWVTVHQRGGEATRHWCVAQLHGDQ